MHLHSTKTLPKADAKEKTRDSNRGHEQSSAHLQLRTGICVIHDHLKIQIKRITIQFRLGSKRKLKIFF